MRLMITIGTTIGGAVLAGLVAWYGDYLPKPVLEPDLDLKVRPLERTVSDISARLAANEQLTKQQALVLTEDRLSEFLRARDQHIKNGETVPDYIQDQIKRLERQVRKLERDLGVD